MFKIFCMFKSWLLREGFKNSSSALDSLPSINLLNLPFFPKSLEVTVLFLEGQWQPSAEKAGGGQPAATPPHQGCQHLPQPQSGLHTSGGPAAADPAEPWHQPQQANLPGGHVCQPPRPAEHLGHRQLLCVSLQPPLAAETAAATWEGPGGSIVISIVFSNTSSFSSINIELESSDIVGKL